MLREGIGVREVADFTNWWLSRGLAEGEKPPKPITKSAWDRHKNGPHFAMTVETVSADASGQYGNVQDIADEMVRRYGTKLDDPNWMPDARETREWAALVAKVADLEQRRRDEAKLMGLMLGASFKPPTVIEVTPKLTEVASAR
jgi:hypothetical protein